MAKRSRFGQRFREVGEAFVALWKAELATIADDLGKSGRALVRALVLVAVAAAVGFWTLGLMLYFGVELLALVLPRWGAVGVVLGLLLLVSLILLVMARKRFGEVESPAATVRRRLDDHRRWWQSRVASEEADEVADVLEGSDEEER